MSDDYDDELADLGEKYRALPLPRYLHAAAYQLIKRHREQGRGESDELSVPYWLIEALIEFVVDVGDDNPPNAPRGWKKIAMHYDRWAAVKRIQSRGTPYREAMSKAAKEERPHVSWKAIERSYLLIEKLLDLPP